MESKNKEFFLSLRIKRSKFGVDNETVFTFDAVGVADCHRLVDLCPVLQRHEHGVRQEPRAVERLSLVVLPL